MTRDGRKKKSELTIWHAKRSISPLYKERCVEQRVGACLESPPLKKSASFEQPNRTRSTSAGQACKSDLVVKSIKEAG